MGAPSMKQEPQPSGMRGCQRDFKRHFADFLEFHASLTGSLDDPYLDALRRLTGNGEEPEKGNSPEPEKS